MTEQRARQVANVVMAAAALGAAVFVLRTPRLRRMAWQLARQYAAGPLAAWTATTVRDAWDASRPRAAADQPANVPSTFAG
ncbi:MAG TPA: hypothetical protein VFK57_22925 [Vicinamibacterales bacterium]|nr:hypothetical protein [Vicinamibacterales bacterium]